MRNLYKEQVVTCDEMKLLEQEANAAGLSYLQMMEHAGCAAADFIKKLSLSGRNVLIFCGKGNNGGDGFVVARKLLESEFSVRLILVEGEPVTEDAKRNYRMIQDRIPILTPDALDNFTDADLIVDAIYGTGFHGMLRKPAADVIRKINRSKSYVTALDIPSGLFGDMTDGELPLCVDADMTVAFHAEKPIHRCPTAQKVLGCVQVADIGIGNILENGDEK